MTGGDDKPRVLVVRRRSSHKEEHHGGSWKVAYADFVTAMMAFFLVMWIMGLDDSVKEVVAGYFSNPVGFEQGFSGGRTPLSMGAAPIRGEFEPFLLLTREVQERAFRRTAEAIEERLAGERFPGDLGAAVEVIVTERGLRIELMDTGDESLFFARSSAELKPRLREVLQVVADEIVVLPNEVVVEGHTDALRFAREGYGNWELSVDRANAARRALVEAGLPGHRIAEIRGFADRVLKVEEDPLADRNRRTSLFLPFLDEEDATRMIRDRRGGDADP